MPAYLAIDLTEATLTFVNPGSPVVTSNGPDGAILWMTDENAPRVASLTDPAAPHPVLYAVDATTMTPLWRSPPDELKVGGKYSSPTVVHGTVFVATDRLQAYGLRP
jgi:outer membrane protein assembly factor BamB